MIKQDDKQINHQNSFLLLVFFVCLFVLFWLDQEKKRNKENEIEIQMERIFVFVAVFGLYIRTHTHTHTHDNLLLLYVRILPMFHRENSKSQL